ncbi:MAG: T9SS type A sorting domain-containing protein [Nanoarchaeota archaeon]
MAIAFKNTQENDDGLESRMNGFLSGLVERMKGAMVPVYTTAALTAGAAGLAERADATIHDFPQQYTTFQAAIDATADGDTVRVGEGNWIVPTAVHLDPNNRLHSDVPDIAHGGHNIKIISREGYELTRFRHQTSGTVMIIADADVLPDSSVIDGITFDANLPTGSNAVRAIGTNTKFQNCHFTRAGAGLDLVTTCPELKVRDCVIDDVNFYCMKVYENGPYVGVTGTIMNHGQAYPFNRSDFTYFSASQAIITEFHHNQIGVGDSLLFRESGPLPTLMRLSFGLEDVFARLGDNHFGQAYEDSILLVSQTVPNPEEFNYGFLRDGKDPGEGEKEIFVNPDPQGVSENDGGETKLYFAPNPARDRVTFHWDGQMGRLRGGGLFDAEGRLVQQFLPGQTDMQLSEKVTPGMYMARYLTDKGPMTTKILVMR